MGNKQSAITKKSQNDTLVEDDTDTEMVEGHEKTPSFFEVQFIREKSVREDHLVIFLSVPFLIPRIMRSSGLKLNNSTNVYQFINMGTAASGHIKRVINRYNASNRALKAIERDKLAQAPSHFSPAIDKEKILENNPELKKELEALKEKDMNLDEYLKKVYLTSTSKNFQFVSKKPLPTKQIRTEAFILADIKCSPGCCTLEDISQMMVMYREDSKKWNPTALAEKFEVDKNSVVNILMYYSFFKKEEFEFINKAPDESKEPQKIEFETFSQLEKKPVKLIEGKKSQ